ncbi:MAG: exopolysaccharide biosynthesis protein [Rhizobiales bacterium]|mgnify:CR=1 FL=1|nr:exopolysaccharide biosynthesis protein [Hyphomicrobiales bacterium]|tara:strand:- start:356 stop:961 length:606 start_codon:yes stop_codon:yes gene_type:complete
MERVRRPRKRWRGRFGRGYRARDVITAICFILLFSFGAAWLESRSREVIEGRPRVIDGDSLELAGRRVRLWGIDAPELSQTCGTADAVTSCGRIARERLRALVAKGDFSCRLLGADRYKRDLADCNAGEIYVNAEMVRSGFAVAYGGFLREERHARAGGKGIWAQDFVRPAEWRKQEGRPDEPSHATLSGIWGFLGRLLGV